MQLPKMVREENTGLSGWNELVSCIGRFLFLVFTECAWNFIFLDFPSDTYPMTWDRIDIAFM